MTRWAEVTARAGKGKQVFMAAIFTFHAGKAVVQITTIKIAINHLLDIDLPSSI